MRNFKKISWITCFLLCCMLGNAILNYALIPYEVARVALHQLETKEYDTLFLGTSHGFSTFDPTVIEQETGETSYNICQGGEYLRDSYFLLKDACRNYTPKRVVYELDPGYWVNPDTENDNYGSMFRAMSWSPVKIQYMIEKMLKADFRTTLFPWYYYREQYKNIIETVKMKQSDNYKNYGLESFDWGVQAYQPAGNMYIYGNPDEEKVEDMVLWDETKLLPETMKYFEKLKKFCEEKNIELVVVTTPIPKETLEKYATEFEKANQYFTNLMKENHLPYYDFNYIDMGNFDRSIDSYNDYEGHMYGKSAEEFSKIVAQTIFK